MRDRNLGDMIGNIGISGRCLVLKERMMSSRRVGELWKLVSFPCEWLAEHTEQNDGDGDKDHENMMIAQERYKP